MMNNCTSGFISYNYALHLYQTLSPSSGAGLIMVRAVFFSGFYTKDSFDRVVILFNFKICVWEFPVEVNIWLNLWPLQIFFCKYLQECFLSVYGCMVVHSNTCTHIYFQGYCFFLALSSSLSWMWDSLRMCIRLCLWVCVWSLVLQSWVSSCVCVCVWN